MLECTEMHCWLFLDDFPLAAEKIFPSRLSLTTRESQDRKCFRSSVNHLFAVEEKVNREGEKRIVFASVDRLRL